MSENATFIQNIITHSYDFFIALKQKLIFIDLTRKLAIKQQYRKLHQKSRNQNVNKWFNKRIKCFDFTKEYRIEKILNQRKFVRNFLFVVDDIDSTFSKSKMNFLNSTIMNIYSIIEQFRNRMRLRKTKKSTSASHFAFAIFDWKESNKESNKNLNKYSNKASNKKNKKSFFRKKSIEAFECICDKKHWYFK